MVSLSPLTIRLHRRWDARFRWFPGIGYYPKSLLGTDVEQVSNAYPPTLCFLFAGVWVIGAAILLLWPLGFGHQHHSTARWWIERPLSIGIPGLILAGVVAVFARYERPRRRAPEPLPAGR